MAVSPVVTELSRPATELRAAASPLRSLASGQASSNGTPKPVGAPRKNMGGNPPSLDLAEQMNEDEKRKWVKGKKLGEGTYAVVFLGHLRDDPSTLVAIKKMKKVSKDIEEGMSHDAIREVKHLQELQHDNIIALRSVFSSKDQNLNLVLEFLPLGDLEILIKGDQQRKIPGVRYGAADIKAWMGMLTRAVWFCHENFVLHRDIKPNNLLIAANGELKLADFGLARGFADPYQYMTANVITRWYRPPELLFGAKHYSGAVDIWSVGTIFAEIVLRNAYLPGGTELEQVKLICEAIGTPTEDNWPGVTKLRDYAVPSTNPVRGKAYYERNFEILGPEGADLLMRTLTLNPNRRITAKEMLQHTYWLAQPHPTRKEDLPRKAGGEETMGADLKRRPGVVEEDRGSRIARKLNFGAG